jgi:hypothetical protein
LRHIHLSWVYTDAASVCAHPPGSSYGAVIIEPIENAANPLNSFFLIAGKQIYKLGVVFVCTGLAVGNVSAISGKKRGFRRGKIVSLVLINLPTARALKISYLFISGNFLDFCIGVYDGGLFDVILGLFYACRRYSCSPRYYRSRI